MSIREAEGFIGTGFTPFDDSQDQNRFIVAAISKQTKNGMDTSAFDAWRQGVELTQSKFVYGSSQPKFWVGNTKGYGNLITYGQARSWTEYENTTSFDDLTIPFNPVLFITLGQNYPVPIYFNDGPMEEEEAIIEPFTIPFRKDPVAGFDPPRQIHGSLEDGNSRDPYNFGRNTNRISSFIPYDPPLTQEPFLDAGQEYVGVTLQNSIVIEGFVPFIQRESEPFNDTRDEEIVKEITLTLNNVNDIQFLAALNSLKFDLEDDIRDSFFQKSAPCGNDVYGTNQAIYGTDSIAYVGLNRGS